ncbi:SubName: Full=Uncharacterized protein {ECO:0000313/EMBL:CCA68911.1} [Serendipita indica DSM 11827]|uniref:Uncharacterized protein n=1 Tax=Serendipita indica (strain DSM 11827) TaxID=1109443 RepID=G4TC54_SERID|nr:SubName: Full=Uncharacterized protein {ECO:0000313/EMBL:CCA68911.1} [Serendipita indica DSM 11827]CCA68911.1 hypothetical protein PIIN_02771 [Serendipita indica DSM 11827]
MIEFLGKSITGSTTPTRSVATTTSSATTVTTQPISVRTLVAICVGCGILLAGLVLFVIWFGARSRKGKQEQEGEVVALDVSKATSESHLKAAPPHAGFQSTYSESSYYSQSTARKPLQGQQHSRRPTMESLDAAKQDPYHYRDEHSFLPKQNVYTRNDMAPTSPRSPTGNPDFSSPQPANSSVHQSPRSTSAQAITRPYVIGSHPFASPGRSTSQSRPSIEHNGNYTVATAPPSASDRAHDGSLGLSGHNTFAGAGTRPGYNAYGLESRQAITSLNTRPSLESIRSAARKASIDQTAVSAATEFAMGGPTAVGGRSRNNSTSSSHRAGGYSYAGGTSSLYGGGGGSVRSGKDGSKEKYTKEERAKEMAAMNSLIAALDESAEKERKRKLSLAEAAGLGDQPSSSKSGSGSMRRKDVAVTGSYPLPPPEVFRAALSTGVTSDDDVDDEEIERWRRR